MLAAKREGSLMSQLSQQCGKLLYRMMWQTPDGIVDAFALCATREDSRRFFSAAISLVSGIHHDELELVQPGVV
jgi:hypothetical protein